MMRLRPRLHKHLRTCRICGKPYITIFRNGKKCFKCYHKKKAMQTLKRKRKKELKVAIERIRRKRCVKCNKKYGPKGPQCICHSKKVLR